MPMIAELHQLAETDPFTFRWPDATESSSEAGAKIPESLMGPALFLVVEHLLPAQLQSRAVDAREELF